jgi:hypothetical protein
MEKYFNKQKSLTICMWDYSWLQCGHPGGAFHDLERRVAEAAERGYNTLRVDVFPNLYNKGEHTFAKTPENKRRVMGWGMVTSSDDYTVNVREKVIELANLCRKYGIWLGLDTWQTWTILPLKDGEKIPLGGEEAASRLFTRAWCEALPVMREDGILERAVWLAPLNEMPLFLGEKLEAVTVSDTATRHEGQTEWITDLPELDAIFKDINTWLGEDIKGELEGDNIPLCYSALGAENYSDRLTDIYDLVDVHFMPDMLLDTDDIIALEKSGKGASKFSMHSEQVYFDLALYSGAWNRACERNYDRMLRLCHNYASNATSRLRLESGKQLQCIMTEGFGPCNHPDHLEVDWSNYYQYNADAARIFAQYPFSGLTISNHAEPIFSAWDNISWQKNTNHFILNQPV